MQNFNSLRCLVFEISAFQYEARHGFRAGASVHKLFVGGVCLKERWLNDLSVLSLFQLNGFTCLSQGIKCCPHDGLITYVDSSLTASDLNIDTNSSSWDGLFVQFQDLDYAKDIIIGDIYRPWW